MGRPPTPSPTSPRYRDYHKHHYDHHEWEAGAGAGAMRMMHPEHVKRGVRAAGDVVGERVSRGLARLTRRSPPVVASSSSETACGRDAGLEEPTSPRRWRRWSSDVGGSNSRESSSASSNINSRQ